MTAVTRIKIDSLLQGLLGGVDNNFGEIAV